MQKCAIAAAFAAAALFGVAAVADTPASAQSAAVDPSVTHPGADSFELRALEPNAAELRAPMPALGSEYARPTQFVPDGEVEVPYGDWVSSFLAWLLGLAGVAAAWLLRRVPSGIVAALDTFSGMLGQGRANEFLENVIGYGINTTAGAARGRTMTVKVGMEVLERALEYAIRHAPELVESLGGAIRVREKIIARLDLDADAELPAPKPPAETLVSGG